MNWKFHVNVCCSAIMSHETKNTTGESSTGKQRCDDCGRWFVNLSSHRKCSRRMTSSPTEEHDASQPEDSRNRRTSHSGTSRKYALQQKALLPKDKILQVSYILIV